MTHPAHIPLVVATRNEHIERIHWGSVAVVDTSGALLAWCGDPQAYGFSRSTLKPFQAIPFVRDGGPAHFGFTEAELALACASHSGEDAHVVGVSSMLAKIGALESDLRCGVQLPLQYGDGNLPPRGSVFDQRHHTCSGKHSGFLGYCCLHGYERTTYLESGHALELDIAREVSALSGLSQADLWFGIDGCSAPNIGMPLSRLAMMWARLAGADSHGGAIQDAVLSTIFSAMAAHPQMVSGTGRCDLAITLASGGDCVAKAGADGVYTVGVRSRGWGIAVRIADGNPSALYVAVVAVLIQLGLLDDAGLSSLAYWQDPLLRNARGLAVGQLRAELQLQFA